MINFKNISIAALAFLFIGCASVGMPNESKELDAAAKEFKNPNDQTAALYIYRPSSLAYAAKLDLNVDGRTIGSLTGHEFVWLTGLKAEKISIIGSFGFENCVAELELKPNQNHYVLAEIESGFFSGGCELKVVNDFKDAKSDIKSCDLVKSFYKH
ncbi:MAG: hypothetical protein ACTTJC_07890 [Campylobacter sp.]